MLPEKLRKELHKGGKSHCRVRSDGLYEYRLTYQGRSISAASSDKKTAKKKFLEKLCVVAGLPKKEKPKTGFADFTENWLENFKKPTLKESTFKQYLSVYRSKLKPAFGNTPLSELTPLTIQPFFQSLLRDGKTTKTAVECKKLLSLIFDAAIGENIIDQNPMKRVVVLKQQPNHGKALTYTEEREFLDKIKGTRFELQFILLLYTGMRRGELASAALSSDHDFITVITGKQRLGSGEVTRSIPVTPMLRRYINDFDKIVLNAPVSTMSAAFHALMPDHHLHELRHTFISRCRECGISREMVGLWVGHTPDDITTEVYTHYSPNYVRSEAEKVDYSAQLTPKK
jgi:integrase